MLFLVEWGVMQPHLGTQEDPTKKPWFTSPPCNDNIWNPGSIEICLISLKGRSKKRNTWSHLLSWHFTCSTGSFNSRLVAGRCHLLARERASFFNFFLKLPGRSYACILSWGKQFCSVAVSRGLLIYTSWGFSSGSCKAIYRAGQV